MTRKSENMTEEADIGSGEKKPAEAETQKMIEQIPEPDLATSAPPDKPNKQPPAQDNRA